MADPQIASVLGRCSDPERGCFASDQGALESMLYMDDGVIRSNYQRIAGAADKAASEGTTLEDATYEPATLEIVGSFTSFGSRGGYGAIGEIGSGEPKRIGDLLEESNSKTEARIARCAYVCGQVGVGNCPIKTPQS